MSLLHNIQQLPPELQGRIANVYSSTLQRLSYEEKIALINILKDDVSPTILLKGVKAEGITPFTNIDKSKLDYRSPLYLESELHTGRFCRVYEIDGQKLIELQYKGVFPYSVEVENRGIKSTVRPWLLLDKEYMAVNVDGGKIALFNTTTQIFHTEALFDEIKEYKYGLAPACIDKKRGFINYNGDWVIPPQFDGAKYFNAKGTCAIYIISSESLENKKAGNQKHKGRWNYIDRTGKLI